MAGTRQHDKTDPPESAQLSVAASHAWAGIADLQSSGASDATTLRACAVSTDTDQDHPT